MMKAIFKHWVLILLLIVISTTGWAQDFTKLLPEEPPKNPAQNLKFLFEGIAIQATGIALTTVSVYYMIELAEEGDEIGPTGVGIGLGLTATGTVLMAACVRNIALERKAWREYHKKQKHKEVSLNLEPTCYGIGIVCRF
jgi:hypothetical protein